MEIEKKKSSRVGCPKAEGLEVKERMLNKQNIWKRKYRGLVKNSPVELEQSDLTRILMVGFRNACFYRQQATFSWLKLENCGIE